MASVPVEVLVGTAFGLLVGIVPALSIGLVSFGVEYYTDRSLPTAAVVLMAVPLVGVVGHYTDVVSLSEPIVPRVVTVGFVGVVLALLAASQGRGVAETVPRELHRAVRAERILAADAVDAIDANGRIAVRPGGDVRDVDGHPSLSPELRDAVANCDVRLPADLPLGELERRFENRLASRFNLSEVSASIDGMGRARVAAAPASRDLAKRVPEGYRAVSVETVAPTGLSTGDVVEVVTEAATVEGTVLSLVDSTTPAETVDRGTAGGESRVTVAVATSEAGPLLSARSGQLVATAAGTTHELEAFSLLDRAGRPVRQVRIGHADHERLGQDDVELLAVRTDSGWRFDPDLDAVSAGDRAFVSGTTSSGAVERYRPGPAEGGVHSC